MRLDVFNSNLLESVCDLSAAVVLRRGLNMV